jgi:hypothetical protein
VGNSFESRFKNNNSEHSELIFIVYKRFFSLKLIYLQVWSISSSKIWITEKCVHIIISCLKSGISEFTEQYKQAGLVNKTDTTYLNP